jgi:hypothetical protein
LLAVFPRYNVPVTDLKEGLTFIYEEATKDEDIARENIWANFSWESFWVKVRVVY